jgi:hypothetical protein
MMEYHEQMDTQYKEEISYAKYLGITAGYGDGNFHPYDLITREMAAQLIHQAIFKMSQQHSVSGFKPFGY